MVSMPDPSQLGTVEDVNGASIGVKISDATPSGLVFVNGEAYRVGQVGGFIRIPCGYVDLFGIISQVGAGAAPGPPESAPLLGNRWLRVELIGEAARGSRFERGISQYPSIGDAVHVVTESELKTIYAPGNAESYVAVGRVAGAESLRAYLDLNRLVSRHCAVVGSTGAGKTTAVASLLGAISAAERFSSARVVLFDLHGEYAKAFGKAAKVFRVGANVAAGEAELQVPFWALTADEFLAASTGPVAGTQLALLQELLLSSKRSSKPGGKAHGLPDEIITLDTPLPFSVFKLWYDLYCLHCATHTVSSNQNQSTSTQAFLEEGSPPAKAVGDADRLVRPKFKPQEPSKIYLAAHANAPRGFLDVLESKLRDQRLRFLFSPGDWGVSSDGRTKADLDSLLSTWIGVDAPVSVFDLSAIPSAVIDDLIGVVLRILYDSLFWGRLKKEGGRSRPLLIVLEEAHAYLGSSSKGRAASAARRIAKEGRKYGVGLMLVSQRPSEIDPTILSQCGTTIALRLTNEADRGQVTSCASDNLKGLFSMLSILRTGEALVVGEAVNTPIRVVIDRPPDGRRPDSDDPAVVAPTTSGTPLAGWTQTIDKEDYRPLVSAWRRQDPKAGSDK